MRLYNSLTRQKEEFVPIVPGEVKMYVCGPTVYNYFHIGNGRTFIIFDTIRRYLEYRGYKVTFIQNFTDIDDKMINKANAEGITVKELGDKFIDEYYQDADGLQVKRATINPRATEYIDEVVEFVKDLIDRGFAYEIDGDVYFSTKKFEEYGKLCGQNLEDLQSGARISVDERKKDPMDFAVWKSQKPGEPAWESPWGLGRPGWHIECSCMAKKLLGDTIDIHGGGMDLKFPHHENEIAQSEAVTGQKFANYWMHAAFVNVDNKKMSKSLGNFFTVRDIAEKYDLQVLRFFMLSAHYRSPINFSAELMEASKNGLERIITAVDRLKELDAKAEGAAETCAEQEKMVEVQKLREKYEAAMEDDFNTADAVSAIFELVKLANSTADASSTKSYISCLLKEIEQLCDVLGIITERKAEVLDSEIEEMIAARQQARKDRNFALADEIRGKLLDMGIVLEDTREGVKWKRA